jgi:hypothetical protein
MKRTQSHNFSACSHKWQKARISFIMAVCHQSACINTAPINRLPQNLTLRTFTKICPGTTYLVKTEQQYNAFNMKTYKLNDSAMGIHGNTQPFFTADNYMQVNNNNKGMHCWIYITTMVTQMRDNVTLSLHSLSCLNITSQREP